LTEVKDDLEARIANMTREERLARIAELLAPVKAYLHEPAEKEAGAPR
jgi:hypothetical protein